jgi:hypothetical protein
MVSTEARSLQQCEGNAFPQNTDGNQLIRPFIREASLIDIVPQPDDDTAIKIGDDLVNKWNEWQEEYKKVISNASGVPEQYLIFVSEEKPQNEWVGLTRQISFPRLQHSENHRVLFDTRICISLCTKHKTKLWSRIGLFEKQEPYGIDVNELSNLLKYYKKITQESRKWLLKQTKRYFNKCSFDLKLNDTYSRTLEISSYGVKQPKLKEFFEKITTERTPLSQLVKDLNIENDFSPILDVVLGTKDSLNKYIFQELDKDKHWFTSPTFIDTFDANNELREVLYLAKSNENKDEVIGIRYDDSKEGNLPRESALQVARWLGTSL